MARFPFPAIGGSFRSRIYDRHTRHDSPSVPFSFMFIERQFFSFIYILSTFTSSSAHSSCPPSFFWSRLSLICMFLVSPFAPLLSSVLYILSLVFGFFFLVLFVFSSFSAVLILLFFFFSSSLLTHPL